MHRSTLRLLGALAVVSLAPQAMASSHREAPLITEDPTADSTDVYAFVSPDGPDPGNGARVTLIANYIPFQEPAGGPNYFKFSDSVLYEIKVDNTGDAIEDIVFQFRFHTEVGNGGTFLYNTGPIDGVDSANLNVKQYYTLTRIDRDQDGNTRRQVLGQNLLTAPARIGPRSNPNYPAVAAQAVHTLGPVKVFVGPRDEGFYLDINAIFDLLNVDRAAGLGNNNAVDGTAGFNVSTLAIEMPVTMLTSDGGEPIFNVQDLGGPTAVIGVWTTASRRKHRALRRYENPRDFGPWIQVSRLGLPLINEVVVPLEFKDQFNRTHPADDLGNIAGYVVDPELAFLLNAVHGIEVPSVPRLDMVEVIRFLPGIATSRDDLQPADLLRLNVSLGPTRQNPDPGGAIAGDFAGFPNGRRVMDDTVDILERVVGGGVLSAEPTAAGGAFGELFPNNALNDGVNGNDVPYMNTFPYLGQPHEGFVHRHDDPPPPP
ncbi:MAG: DUF4331 domain-containing protein [Myxococcales bacterium]|nr:DUF4331 domain-containing protein [Myxococcales bacterium]